MSIGDVIIGVALYFVLKRAVIIFVSFTKIDDIAIEEHNQLVREA